MVIYLVRHAKDDESYRGGWSDLGLVEEGLNQAKLLGQYLHENSQEFCISKLISSDLKRAIQTTREIEKALQIEAQFSSEWRETNNGVLAGMLNSDALEVYPGLFFNALEMDEPYPEGESPREFYNRIKDTFNELCQSMLTQKENHNVMIVTHSGVINIIYYLVKGLEWTNKSPNLSVANHTSIHKFDYKKQEWEIIESNNIAHLKEK